MTLIPCVRPGCGHDYEDQHSADASADGCPCLADGCACPDGVLDEAGLLAWLDTRRPAIELPRHGGGGDGHDVHWEPR